MFNEKTLKGGSLKHVYSILYRSVIFKNNEFARQNTKKISWRRLISVKRVCMFKTFFGPPFFVASWRSPSISDVLRLFLTFSVYSWRSPSISDVLRLFLAFFADFQRSPPIFTLSSDSWRFPSIPGDHRRSHNAPLALSQRHRTLNRTFQGDGPTGTSLDIITL